MSTPDCTTFSTLAIHAGFDPDPITGDVVPPIHVASTFVQDRPGELREGYEYGRCGNPTTNAFAGALAALEGATHGFAFPSGMSAEDTVIRLLARPGDHVVHSTDVYGGTHKLLSVIKPAEGITSEAVDLTDWLATEKDGLDTAVGDMGERLSGGQRQRLALARALLRDAPIYVFDEATSQVDPATEARVREGIARVAKGRTIVEIAHRISAVRDADQIIVMDAGRVVELSLIHI